MDYHSSISNYLFIFLQRIDLTTSHITVLFVILGLLIIGLFLVSGSEVAFFSLSVKDLGILKARQQPYSRRIVNLLEQPKTLHNSLLISNIIFSISIILICNILVDHFLPDDYSDSFWVRFLIKFGIILFVLVFLCGILPKAWAAQDKIRFAASSSLLVEILHSLFFGLSKRLQNLSSTFEADKIQSSLESERELDEVIDLLPENEVTSEEKQILKGIKNFSDTSVKQIMRTRMDVSGMQYAYNMQEVLDKVQRLNYSRIPVYKNNLDEIVGMLHTKDLLPHINESADFNWHNLIRPAFFVHEQKSIDDLLQDFRKKRIHFGIVVDEFGGTSGIVTLEDIMEEIIGDIRDEFDDEESVNKKIDDYNYIFEGKLMINDACKAMGLPIDTFDAVRGESDSVAGLVMEIAGEFPQENQQVISGDFIFTPIEINKTRMEKVHITIQQSV